MSEAQFHSEVMMELELLEAEEQWKRHPEFKCYWFSSWGNVVSVQKSIKVLSGTKCGRGYRALDLRGDGTRRREYIHRTICLLFNGPCPEGYECRHLDGNISNNRATNLKWGTPQENADDKILHGTNCWGEKNPMAVLTREKVERMRQIREETGMPYHQIAKQYQISTMTAFRAITKRAWV
jgi:hypothetical protein